MDLVSLLNSSSGHLLTICRLSASVGFLLPLYFVIPIAYTMDRTQNLEKVAEALPFCHNKDTKGIKIEKLYWLYTDPPWSSWPADYLREVQKNSVRSLGDSRADTCCKLFSRIQSIRSYG